LYLIGTAEAVFGYNEVMQFIKTAERIRQFAWTLVAITCGLAVVAWGQTYEWQLSSLTLYQIFPLLGLLAFSIMWTHYLAGAVREKAGLQKEALSSYFRRTSLVVLALICLHPGLLVFQLFRDGAGLPPGSYNSYVGPGMAWLVMLGTVSLLVFLAFEFHRIFGPRSWWQYVADASDLAMIAIFYHGLRLGSQLQQGWFRYVWWFYGLVLVVVLVRKYYLRFASNTKDPAIRPGL
jgi:hypothetical protein